MARAPAWGQTELSRAERECWDRHPGQVEYVKCIAATMEPIDPAKRHWYGEFYGAKEYLRCALTQPPGDTSCDKHRLRRRDAPEYWPETGNVSSMKRSDSASRAVYKKGMTSSEYFKALCVAEAGEFVHKALENIEGIYQIRPRNRAGHHELRDRYVLEDPYGYSQSEAERPGFLFVGSEGYDFFESPRVGRPLPSHEEKHYDSSFFVEAPKGARVERYVRRKNADGKLWGTVRKEFGVTVKSRYGYTWREIRRPMDRELGVVGGELAVVDLETKEILGLLRGFAHSGYVRNVDGGFQWEIAQMCPTTPNFSGGDLAPRFIKKVLKPAQHARGTSNAAK